MCDCPIGGRAGSAGVLTRESVVHCEASDDIEALQTSMRFLKEDIVRLCARVRRLETRAKEVRGGR
jgi:hypothetical protein